MITIQRQRGKCNFRNYFTKTGDKARPVARGLDNRTEQVECLLCFVVSCFALWRGETEYRKPRAGSLWTVDTGAPVKSYPMPSPTRALRATSRLPKSPSSIHKIMSGLALHLPQHQRQIEPVGGGSANDLKSVRSSQLPVEGDPEFCCAGAQANEVVAVGCQRCAIQQYLCG